MEKYYLCLKKYFNTKDYRKEYCIKFDKIIYINNKYYIIINDNEEEIEFINNKFLDKLRIKNKEEEYYIINDKNEILYYNENKQQLIEQINPCLWHVKQQKILNKNENIKMEYKYNDNLRADIYIDKGIQIEFQHSIIKPEKIKERTINYLKHCKILFWILDYTSKERENDIILLENNNIEINVCNEFIRNFINIYDNKNTYLLINYDNMIFYISKENLEEIRNAENKIKIKIGMIIEKNFYNMLNNEENYDLIINDFDNIKFEQIFNEIIEPKIVNKKYIYQKCAGSGKTYNSLHLLDFNLDLQRYYNKNLFIYLTKIKSNRTDLCNKFFNYYKNNEFKNKFGKSFEIKNIIINKKKYEYKEDKLEELINISKEEQNSIIIECEKNNENKSSLYIIFGTVDSFNYCIKNCCKENDMPILNVFKNILKGNELLNIDSFKFKGRNLNERTLLIFDETQDLENEYINVFKVLDNLSNKCFIDYHIVGDNLQTLYTKHSLFKEFTELSKDKNNNIYLFDDYENKCIRFYNYKLKDFINKFINNLILNKPNYKNYYKIKPLNKIRTDFNYLIKTNEFINNDDIIKLDININDYNLNYNFNEIINDKENNKEDLEKEKIIKDNEKINDNIKKLSDYIYDLMLNKEDINLPSDILIVVPFPKKDIYSSLEQYLNIKIKDLLHNKNYQNKIINAFDYLKKTNDYNNILINEQIEHLEYYYNLIKNNEIDNYNYVKKHSSSDRGGINLDLSKHMIRILSIHSSKGLTCKNVFALNINEKDIKQFCKTDDNYDLCVKSFFYVAYTRASHRLFYTLNSVKTKDDYKIHIDDIITYLQNENIEKENKEIKEFNDKIKEEIIKKENNNLFEETISSDDYNFNIIRFELLNLIYDIIVNYNIKQNHNYFKSTIFGGCFKKILTSKINCYDIYYKNNLNEDEKKREIERNYNNYMKKCNDIKYEIPILINNEKDKIFINYFIKKRKYFNTSNFIKTTYNYLLNINNDNNNFNDILKDLLIINYLYRKLSKNPYLSSLNLFELLNLIEKNIDNQTKKYLKQLEIFKNNIKNNIQYIENYINNYKIEDFYNYNTNIFKICKLNNKIFFEKIIYYQKNRKTFHIDFDNNLVNVYIYNDINNLTFGDYLYEWIIKYIIMYSIIKIINKRYNKNYNNKLICRFIGIDLKNVIYDFDISKYNNILNEQLLNNIENYIINFICSNLTNKLNFYNDKLIKNDDKYDNLNIIFNETYLFKNYDDKLTLCNYIRKEKDKNNIQTNDELIKLINDIVSNCINNF